MLARALQADSDITTIGEANFEAVGLPERRSVSLVVVDSSHPDGFALVSAIRDRFPRVRVVVLAVYHRDEVFLAWADVGISGYLEPNSSTDELVATIRQAAAGEVVCPPRLTALLLNRFTNQSNARQASAGIPSLTGREREVLELLADGLANKRISRQLRIAEATVKNHIHSILQKLDLRSRGEAAAYFRQSGQEYVKQFWSDNVRRTRMNLLGNRPALGSHPAENLAAFPTRSNRRSDRTARRAS
jgi:DNA-binding NarL/FixJ family response regulator